jgi:hypothetical protein
LPITGRLGIAHKQDGGSTLFGKRFNADFAPLAGRNHPFGRKILGVPQLVLYS